MKIDRISFEQLYPTGVYANQRFRAEAQLENMDDIGECYNQLRKCVEAAFVAANPQIEWNEIKSEPTIPIVEEKPKVSPEDKITAFIATINMCTNIKFLQNFKKRVIEENNEELYAAYNAKEIELLNKKN